MSATHTSEVAALLAFYGLCHVCFFPFVLFGEFYRMNKRSLSYYTADITYTSIAIAARGEPNVNTRRCSKGFVVELFLRFKLFVKRSYTWTYQQKTEYFSNCLFHFCNVQMPPEQLWKKVEYLVTLHGASHKNRLDFFGECDFQETCTFAKKPVETFKKTLLELVTPDQLAEALHILNKEYTKEFADAFISDRGCFVAIDRIWTDLYKIDPATLAKLCDEKKISSRQYDTFRQIFPGLFPQYTAISNEQKQIQALAPANTTVTLSPDTLYTRADVKKKIASFVTNMIAHKLLSSNSRIRLKFSGDGFNLYRRKWLMFSISTVDVETPHADIANWLLGMAACDEQAPASRFIVKQLETELSSLLIDKITLPDKHVVDVEYFCCADQKFMCHLLGLTGPKCNYFCPWCIIHKKAARDPWTTGALRTVVELQRGGCLGQKQQPLMTFIQMDHVIPDLLHLTMRCTEKLLLVLYLDLVLTESDMRENNGVHLQKLFEDKIKVVLNNQSFQFKAGEAIIKKPNFSGGQTERILKRLTELVMYKPGEPDVSRQQKLEVVTLHQQLFWTYLRKQHNYTPEQATALTVLINKWAQMWMLRFKESFTNSCHVVYRHVPCYVEMYSNIYKFSQQGVEHCIQNIQNHSVHHVRNTAKITQEIMNMDNRRLVRLPENLAEIVATVCESCEQRGHVRTTSNECLKKL